MAFSDWFCYLNVMHEDVKVMKMEGTLCISYLLLYKTRTTTKNYHQISGLKPHTFISSFRGWRVWTPPLRVTQVVVKELAGMRQRSFLVLTLSYSAPRGCLSSLQLSPLPFLKAKE